MEWLRWLLESPLPILFILAGLLLLVVSLVSLGSIHISDPADRVLARRISYFLLALGIFLQFSPVLQDYLQSSTTNQYTLKTFRKDGDIKKYQPSFFSSENIFAEFDLNDPDLEKKRKFIRWTNAGNILTAGRYKWVDNSGQIELGTFQPGSYEVRAFFRRDDRSDELLARQPFQVIQP